MTAPLPRVRVTAPRTATRLAAPRPGPGDPSTLYVRSLIRSQLRVALLAAGAFAIVLAAITAVLALVPEVRALTVVGIPIAWIVLGAGIYPIVLLIGALVVRATDRNEQRYRSLADEP
ncbi:hypothetical protein [Pseudolysinimonas sp.]